MIGSEWLLRKFCRHPRRDTTYDREGWSMENALAFLEEEIPDIRSMIEGKVVLDFGCGYGYQVVAMAKCWNAAKCIGVDIVQRYIERARQLAWEHGVQDKVEFFCPSLPLELEERVDVVLSLNSFEHYANPKDVLYKMIEILQPGGKVIITFGPLWYSPYGAHMIFMTSLPWVHLIFKEAAIMRVRADYRNDGAKRFEEVEGGLNRMSLRKFERILAEACRERGVRVDRLRYRSVKRVPIVTRIPIIRELLTNHATCILLKE